MYASILIFYLDMYTYACDNNNRNAPLYVNIHDFDTVSSVIFMSHIKFGRDW
jgi:hypothetical protein